MQVDWWACSVELSLDGGAAVCTLPLTSEDEPLADATRGYADDCLFVCVDPFPGQRVSVSGARLRMAAWRKFADASRYSFRHRVCSPPETAHSTDTTGARGRMEQPRRVT
jgi:hypothetical protein